MHHLRALSAHRPVRRIATNLFVALSLAVTCKTAQAQEPPNPTTGLTAPAASMPLRFKFGGELYLGVSTSDTYRSFSDGFWAGSEPFYPSVVHLAAEDRQGNNGKVTLGIGGISRGDDRQFDQPLEAWWQTGVGKRVQVTVGKFWVPLGLQEWEYESRPGVQADFTVGNIGYTASLNYNKDAKNANLYIRANRDIRPGVNVGMSVAVGRGLSYGSEHDTALGIDTTATVGAVKIQADGLVLARGTDPSFAFLYSRLESSRDRIWEPYLAGYYWEDRADDWGRFRSLVGGLTVHLSKNLSVESAVAATADRPVGWLQIYWTFGE